MNSSGFKQLKLTRENYYTPEADWAYMSCSQYQGFLQCEAREMAKLQGRWIEEPGEALVVGNYVHSYLEGEQAHEQFLQAHFEEIFKTRRDKRSGMREITGKYAPFAAADRMLGCIKQDATLRRFLEMPGHVEEVMAGELFGVPWRIRMDKRIESPRIILDWKTAANLRELRYDPQTGSRVTFIEEYGYLMRAAVYSEIEKQNTGESSDPVFLIAAVSKQDPPDKGLFMLNHRDRYDYELQRIREQLPRILRVKEGAQPPRRCGRCDYCRETAGPLRIKPYYTLKPENWEGWELEQPKAWEVGDTHEAEIPQEA